MYVIQLRPYATVCTDTAARVCMIQRRTYADTAAGVPRRLKRHYKMKDFDITDEGSESDGWCSNPKP
eukprot:1746473-Rhodomonas_salina.5